MSVRSLIKDFIPPIVARALRPTPEWYGFSGDYASWSEATAAAAPYETDVTIFGARRQGRATELLRTASSRAGGLPDGAGLLQHTTRRSRLRWRDGAALLAVKKIDAHQKLARR